MQDARDPVYATSEMHGGIPTDARKPYDVREVIARIVDGSELDEFKPLYGTTLVTGFAHIFGYPAIGVIGYVISAVIGLWLLVNIIRTRNY